MDEGLGRLLDRVRHYGMEENTIVFFTSDNGPQMSANVRRYNANWAGAKGNVYEGGIRVSAVVRWPGRVERSVRSDAMMHFVDWLPTLATLCDIGLPTDAAGPLDGIDVAACYERTVPPPHPPELYNLAADPFEQCDLAPVETERTSREQGYARRARGSGPFSRRP